MKTCKHCHAKKVIKNGSTTSWKGGRKFRRQAYRCTNCGKTAVGERIYV